VKDQFSKEILDQIIDEILSEMPLKEKASLANKNKDYIDVLQYVFNLYIQAKKDPDDEDYKKVITEIWKRLQDTHQLRVVK
jgi:hypothetical protein